MMFSNRVGIIGAHCSELKSLMSTSDRKMEEAKEEEEEVEEQEQGRTRSGFSMLSNDLSLPPRSPPNNLSRRSSVLSGATAEGDCNQSK